MFLLPQVSELLVPLGDDRREHSMSAGGNAASAQHLVADDLRADLMTAATLHDVGYAHPDMDFHPLDGARFLAGLDFSPVVCHLVAHHSASTYEADARGIALSAYQPFDVGRDDLGPAHSVMWWADLITGPQGQDMTVEDRLDDIAARYGPDDVVTRFTSAIRPILLAAGQSPVGSIQVRS